ncbi:multidrug transporter [Pseudomonas cavernae]|uniref:Multidrug transporter n=1 Tax=Pseudomonas cavernae TaxID=2320867 RepID=A0A385YYL8_9PSED|nr:multidrug transporter [Pseudomonas cavernae]AYC31866.1 multidrug transporter [Pseudomonas cavernae]
MLIGALLVLTWLILLIRYPAKAMPISGAALIGLLLIGAWMYWLDQREARQLAHLELRLVYAPEQCPADRPLALSLKNGSRTPLQELRWKVAAYAPGDSVNLAETLYDAPRYRGPGELLPGASWHDCLPLPPLRPGYRPATLEFRAERLQGSFAD